MKNYSEKQLLLLDNFVYLPCSLCDGTIGQILDNYRDAKGRFTIESVEAAGVGGGMAPEEICDLFNSMDQEGEINPEFLQLSAARKLNGGYVRAICYTDANDENAVVAFRGTGGSDAAWIDNFKGGYEEDTKMQRLASDFIKNECKQYEDITVTGHSKGGNLSQYVTVTCNEQIARCVSYDGQGFNKSFIEENAAKIEIASPKIKSISAFNDFVNILLTPIAGTIVYAINEESGVNAHSAMALLTSNEYDTYGNIMSTKEQSCVSKTLKEAADKIVEKITPFSSEDKSLLSHVTGATIATALRSENDEKIIKTIGTLSGGTLAIFVKKLADIGAMNKNDVHIEIGSIYFDEDKIKIVESDFSDIIPKLMTIKEAINDLNIVIADNITLRLYSEKKLNKVCDSIDRTIFNIRTLIACIEDIRIRYVEKEKMLSDLFVC